MKHTYLSAFLFKIFLSLCFYISINFSAVSQTLSSAAGQNHSLFICSDSTVMVCGLNSSGQLGDGTTSQRVTPVQLTTLSGIIAVSAGGNGNANHSLFLKSDGTVWACGSNSSGQLGDGTTSQRNTPVQVSGLTGIKAISAGGVHSLFLKSDGTVWACGFNLYGQLGNGTTVQKNTPVKITVLSGIIAIAAGGNHSLFLKSDGTVWACGKGGSGALGYGSISDKSTPVQAASLSGIIGISGGYQHSLFVKNDGAAWACGSNGSGQLGDGTTTQRTSPVLVNIISNITAVAAGGQHSLFLKNDGTVWACGANHYGQFGDGTTTGQTSPVQSNIISAAYIAAAGGTGGLHSLFLKSSGSPWSCGRNSYGQLGDGTTSSSPLPIQPGSLCTPALPDPPISGGDADVCSSLLPVVLTAIPPSGCTVDWYDAPSGGTLLLSGSNNFSAGSAGTYYAESRETSTGFVSASRTAVSLSVSATPAPPSSGGNQTICADAVPAVLTVSSPDSVVWYDAPAAGNILSTGNNYTVSSAGTYYAEAVSTSSGCTSASRTAVSLSINALPSLSANTSASTVCSGTSVTLTGSGASSYVWTGGVTDGVGFVPGSTQTYTVTGTDVNGCTNTASQTITVNSLPAVGANASAGSVCAGTSVTLSGSGAVSYVWTGGVTDAVGFIPASTQSYTVTGTDGNGCTNTASRTVTVMAVPSLSMSKVNATCTSINGMAAATASSGVSPYTYLWSNGGTASAISYIAPGNYTCTVSGSNGCGSSGTVSVTAVPCGPTKLQPAYCGISLTSMAQTLYCIAVTGATNYQYRITQQQLGFSTIYTRNAGSSTTFYMSAVNGLLYNTIYNVEVRAYVSNVWGRWGVMCTVKTPVTVPLTYVLAPDCGDTLPVIDKQVSCYVVYNATKYEWKWENASIGFSKTIQTVSNKLNPVSVSGIAYAQTYTVTVRSYVGSWSSFGPVCTVSTPASVPLTKLTSYCPGTTPALSTQLNCSAVGGTTSYQYHITGGGGFDKYFTSGSSSTNFKLSWVSGTTINKTYNVSVRAYSCGTWGNFGTICAVTTGPLPRFAGEPDEMEASMNLYPNPVSGGQINISFEGMNESGDASIEIYNMMGEKIYSLQEYYSPSDVIPVFVDERFAGGIYFVSAVINGERFYKKISIVQ